MDDIDNCIKVKKVGSLSMKYMNMNKDNDNINLNINKDKDNINLSKDDSYPNFIRASGDCICKQCGKKYEKHSFDLSYLDWDGYPYLHKLCDGTLVKL